MNTCPTQDPRPDPTINRIYREKHETMDDAIDKIALFEDNEPNNGGGDEESKPAWGIIRFEEKNIHISFSGHIPYRKRYLVTLISVIVTLTNLASQYIMEWLAHIRI